ncbi:UDP-glucuronosyl/UDP-glucosyltransferase [Parasponia andersonii]|uniref:UDP-glucuronosyl/UDP-glucosyltransferase n=1 Tax=Parasponia andersonii TaxID=3476 RepID=A0A2P5C649_PARAD|nr:UDP-glucuronosyl/UDP-glucosyltransferase [Parasponia andersonii]
MGQRKGRRVVLFPLPLQGHINPMLELANILHSKGFSITLIHTNFNSPNPSNYPHFTFHSIPDGLSETEASTNDLVSLLLLLNIKCAEPFTECLAKMVSDASEEPIACLISDAIFHFTQAVADSLKLPRVVLRTGGASSFVVFAAFPILLERGYLPIQDSRLEELVIELPPLKLKDLPSVVYVSFGGIAALSEAEFLEIAWDLANSEQPFLWVVRPGSVHGSEWLERVPKGFLENLGGRGHIVKWAPQQEVLAHLAVGAFWTHNGWNSTLESVCEGVPMICMPCFSDQKLNARYVSHVLKVGVQLENGILERGEIERSIRKLMKEKEGEEIRCRVSKLKEKAIDCLKQDGWFFMQIFG